ncbi:hypothetical protein [Thioalkalivibrio sp. ALJT]|uniref:hypothetical protein n=1 Tax=Thioalkalivibrio sp. ALJT TaxID=1158146 RepID=UPI000360FCFB|nr:hypothetical protein [Thioalkalivibrio sp. ALJT]
MDGLLEFEQVSPIELLPILGAKAGSIAELRQFGTSIARLARPSGGFFAWFGKPELHFTTTRMYMTASPDERFFTKLQHHIAFLGMPRRQKRWRAGAGTVTLIEETSTDRKTLSGLFSYRDEHYQLNGQRADWSRLFDYTLRDRRDLVATFRPKEGIATTGGWFVEMVHPRPLGAIAIACHMALWLEESVRKGGTGGGGGPAGGGGGC